MSLFGNRPQRPTSGSRTAAEREAARKERERRRGAPSDEPAAAQAIDPPQPVLPEPQQAPLEVPPAEGPPLLPEPQSEAQPLTEEQRDLEPQAEDEQTPLPPLPAIPKDPLPTGPLRSRTSRRRGHRDSLLERRANRLREHRATRRSSGGHVTKARVAALTGLLLALALLWFLISLFQPFHGSGQGKVIVEIPANSSSSQIGSILSRDGVVSSSFFFDARALLEGKRSDLHSGRFQLRRDMSYSAAIAALSKPPPAKIPVKVLIPEGENRRQIAQIVSSDGMKGDYLAASAHSRLLDPAHYGAPRDTPDLEGFLFPATYDMNAGTPVSRLVTEQLVAFQENFGEQEIHRAKALGVTPYQLLIVASMIEREAQIPSDRPKIAAVIYNRLRVGMPLGIDASIYYAVELEKGIATYTGELTESQLHSNSPYNTRTHKGLPPTPISNPGVASITAAAHPAHVSYLYYVAGADGCGEQVFSTTAAQFEKDVAAYRQAVNKNGGKPPACKHK